MKQSGFTLIELMITVAIIGILSSTALANYKKFVARAKFAEIISLSAKYKREVQECISTTGSKMNCNAGQNGVSDEISTPVGNLDSMTIMNGTIHLVSNFTFEDSGVSIDIIYTPLAPQASGIVKFLESGTCKSYGIC